MAYLEEKAVRTVHALKFPIEPSLFESGTLSSRIIGSNMEFETYDPYFPGADLRLMDWKVYARSGRKLFKRYGSDLRASVELYLDASRSMKFENKAEKALQIAALLLYFFSRHHRVSFFWVNDAFHAEGQVQVHSIEEVLNKVRFGGEFRLPSLPTSSRTTRFFITDFWDMTPWLQTLLKYRFKLIHLLSPMETDLDFKGYVNFVDMEKKSEIRISVSHYKSAYQREFQKWQENLQHRFSEQGLWYGLIRTDRCYYTELIRLIEKGGGK